jgi:hypothetical protein
MNRIYSSSPRTKAAIRDSGFGSISAEGSEALAEYVLTAETGSMPPLSLWSGASLMHFDEA